MVADEETVVSQAKSFVRANSQPEDYAQKLIPLVNRFQDRSTELGASFNFDLPQIAVVGVQSAGKSSILENFVGKDFLPRGAGVVTRRPLVLQLINDPVERAVFLHKPQEYTDYEQVRAEIEAETDRVTGRNKGISADPINLKIYSPNVLNLTLVDLPGITRVPQGEQSEDIETIVREMILQFIEKPNCLILAVSPANIDLSASDALQLAKRVDPQGQRTIGVITKLDLMDPGTDAGEVLRNRVLPLSRGYVGVVNRSQEGINNRIDMQSAIKSEADFFRKHPKYREIAKRQGTPYLRQYLNRQLTEHIRQTLPNFMDSVHREQLEVLNQMKDYAEIPVDPNERLRVITELVNRVLDRLQNELGNNLSRPSDNLQTDALNGGARIKQIFTFDFSRDIAQQTIADELALRREICFAIQNANGIRAGHFIAEKVYENIVRKQIARLLKPSIETAERVTTMMSLVLRDVFEVMKNYPRLLSYAMRRTREFLDNCEKTSKEQIELQFQFENTLISTRHADIVTSDIQKKKSDIYTAKDVPIAVGSDLQHVNAEISRSKFTWTAESNAQKTNEPKSASDESDDDEMLSTDGGYSSGCVSLDGAVLHHYKPNNEGEGGKLLLFPRGTNAENREDAIELVTNADRKVEQWLDGFHQAGFYPRLPLHDRERVAEYEEFLRTDETTNKNVETVREMVRQYMDVEVKTIETIVPKIVSFTIVDQQAEFLKCELLCELMEKGADLLEESPQVARQRNELNARLEMCSDIIGLTDEINSLAGSL